MRYNAFGFNVGGPLFIPHVYNTDKSKTFFFYNMEWRKLIQGQQIYVTAIPGQEFNGNFSNLSEPITVPQTTDPAAIAKFAQYGLKPGQQFPGNQIPQGLIDPNAAAFLAAGALPQPNAQGNHYSQAAPVPTDLREEIVRIDHQLSDRLSLMGHLIWDSSNNSYARSLWSGDTYPTIGTLLTAPSYSAVIRLTHTISPSLLNEIAYDYDGNELSLEPTGLYQRPSDFNVPEYFSANNLNRLPTVQIGTPYSVNYETASWPWHNIFSAHTFRDDLSWTHGNHNFKFGGYVLITHKNQDIFGNTNGNFSFNGSFTGNAFSDFLLGYASGYSELDIQDAVHIRTTNIALYGVDNWRVNNNLTLNLGLRWEGVPHAYDLNGRLSNFLPGMYDPVQAPQFNADGSLNPNGPGFTTVPGIALSDVPFYLNGIGLAGQNGVPEGLVKNHWRSFAPRVGFAYDVAGNQKTVIRGGFGMFYERIQGNDVYNMGPNPPFSFNPSPSNVYFSNPTVSDVTGLQAAFPIFPSSFTALAYTDYKLPTTMQYSLGVQRQLSRNAFVSLSYVGSHDYHLPDVRNINPVPQRDPNRLAICGKNCDYSGTQYNANFDRFYPGWAAINMTEAATTSNYNSLQASLRLEASNGLTFQAAYTYSHALDYVSADLNTLANPFDRGYSYGSGDFDRRHVAIFSYIYELPFFRNSSNKFLHSIVGGWELSGITMFESGTPLTPTLGYDNLGLGGGTTNRPDMVSSAAYPRTVYEWFNPASFVAPGPLQWGSAARGSLVGPGRNNWNMALFKSFALPWLREGARFEFRGETYNTFNHTQFHDVNTTFSDSNFGQVTSVYDPRIIQLGAKLVF